jgi:putative addiction module component (TIGR02574 family)
MPPTVETIEADALQLSAAERAQLIERLITSLDVDPEVEVAWAAEVARRHAEIQNGTVTPLPGPETLAELEAELVYSVG